jgi:hypothetical protein
MWVEKPLRNRTTTATIGLAKAGQNKVIEHLCINPHLCYIWADGFQRPALAKP